MCFFRLPIIVILGMSCIFFVHGEWIQIGGLEGGYTGDILKVGTNLFAATGNGLYYSTDNASSWILRNSGLPENMYQSRLAMMLNKSGDTILIAGTQFALYRSTNNGLEWNKVTSGVPGSCSVPSLVVFHEVIFAGIRSWESGYTDIYRSSDYGQSWAPVGFGFQQQKIFFLSVSPNGKGDSVLFAGVSDNGLYCSTDKGDSWARVASYYPTTVSDKDCFLICDDSIKGTSLFLSNPQNGIFRSFDYGINWNRIDSISEWNYIMALSAITNVKNKTILVKSQLNGLSQSTDLGDSWSTFDPGFCTIFNKIITTNDNHGDTTLIAVTSLGILRSTDGGNKWTPTNTGMKSSIANAFVACTTGTGESFIFATNGRNGDIFRSADEGNSWTKVHSTNGCGYISTIAVCNHADGGVELLVGTQGKGLLISPDYGEHWATIGIDSLGENIISMAVSPDSEGNEVIYIGTEQGFYFSTDYGTSWNTVTGWNTICSRLQNSGVRCGVSCIAAASGINNKSYLFARPIDFSGTFGSTDNGVSWNWIDSVINDTCHAQFVTSFDDGKGGLILFVTSNQPGNNVYKSTDFGNTWINADSGLCCYIDKPFFQINYNNQVFICAIIGKNLFLYINADNYWVPFDSIRIESSISALEVSKTALIVGIQTNQAGSIFQKSLSDLQTRVNNFSNKLGHQITYFNLKPIICDHSVTFTLLVDKSSVVCMDIYSLSGKKMGTILSGRQNTGKRRVTWNYNGLAYGVYFIRLRTESLTFYSKAIHLN